MKILKIYKKIFFFLFCISKVDMSFGYQPNENGLLDTFITGTVPLYLQKNDKVVLNIPKSNTDKKNIKMIQKKVTGEKINFLQRFKRWIYNLRR